MLWIDQNSFSVDGDITDDKTCISSASCLDAGPVCKFRFNIQISVDGNVTHGVQSTYRGQATAL